MSQTNEIIGALEAAGIPMSTDQLAEQLPHIPRQNISSLCSQLRKRGLLAGEIEGQRLMYRPANGAAAATAGDVDIDEPGVDDGDAVESGATTDSETPARSEAAAKPPTQSFSPAGLNIGADLTTDSLVAKPLRVRLSTDEIARRADQRDKRLSRELAAAVLSRWPGQIPYDIQQLINSAAALPL